jgi:hypothetical protein
MSFALEATRKGTRRSTPTESSISIVGCRSTAIVGCRSTARCGGCASEGAMRARRATSFNSCHPCRYIPSLSETDAFGILWIWSNIDRVGLHQGWTHELLYVAHVRRRTRRESVSCNLMRNIAPPLRKACVERNEFDSVGREAQRRIALNAGDQSADGRHARWRQRPDASQTHGGAPGSRCKRDLLSNRRCGDKERGNLSERQCVPGFLRHPETALCCP